MKSFLFLLGALMIVNLSAQIPLDDALDTQGLSLAWVTSGAGTWYGQSAVTSDGMDAAESGYIPDDFEAWLRTVITGPARLSFNWKVGSEPVLDTFRFEIDGELRAQISGNVGWVTWSGYIPEGQHVLLWRYVKEVPGASLPDLAWLDQVKLEKSEGPPEFKVQPIPQTVWEGASVELRTVALGSTPMTHQWYFNATNPIPGGDRPTLILSNFLPAHVRGYSVVTENAAGRATSEVATVSLRNNPSATTAWLYADGSVGSIFSIALAELGWSTRIYTNDLDLVNAALQVPPAARSNLLLVIDSMYFLPNLYDAVANHVGAGGSSLVHGFVVLREDRLASFFGVAIEHRFTSPLPVFSWSGSPLFTGVSDVMPQQEIGYRYDGGQLYVLPGGYAAAGFTLEKSPDQAAIVIGNGGRTIINGFYFQDAVSVGDAVQLAKNEILFLTSPVSARAPIIKTQPRNSPVVPGGSITLRSTGWGAEPIQYQWFKDGTMMPGATRQFLTLTQVSEHDSGDYHLVASNGFGVARSSAARVTLVTNMPVRRLLLLMDEPALSPYVPALSAVSESYTFASQEHFPNETSLTAAVVEADVRDTLVVVDSALQSRGFSALIPFVAAGGRAILQYWGLTGEVARAFGASVTGNYTSPPRVFDWGGSTMFSGLTPPLQLFNRYVVDAVRLQPSGDARPVAGYGATPTPGDAALILGNHGRTILSGFSPIIVDMSNGVALAQNELNYFLSEAPPVIARQPVSSATLLGAAVTFSVAAAGTRPFSFEWRKDGANIPGANQATYTIDSVQSNHVGDYVAQVRNPFGAVTSAVVRLEIARPIVVVHGPISQSNVAGASVTFSVEIDGYPPPFNYEWRKLNAPLFTNRFDSYERTSFFTITNIQPSHIGSYRVVIRNAASPLGVSSATFSCTRLTDTDQDGVPDLWEAAYKMDYNNPADAILDADGDGLTAWQEYEAGTNPTDPSSQLRVHRITASSPTRVEFNALANKTYTMQFTDDLQGRTWTKLQDVVAQPVTRIETLIDAEASPTRYYRLATPRLP